jgi:hypothetical protein
MFRRRARAVQLDRHQRVIHFARFRLSALPAIATRCASICAWSRTALSAATEFRIPACAPARLNCSIALS